MLGGVTGAVRFDIIDGKQTRSWRIAIDDGELGVAPDGGDADSVVTAEHALFNGITRGEVNAMAALLRGDLAVTGNPDLMVAVQRLFPGPPRTRDRGASAEGGPAA